MTVLVQLFTYLNSPRRQIRYRRLSFTFKLTQWLLRKFCWGSSYEKPSVSQEIAHTRNAFLPIRIPLPLNTQTDKLASEYVPQWLRKKSCTSSSVTDLRSLWDRLQRQRRGSGSCSSGRGEVLSRLDQ